MPPKSTSRTKINDDAASAFIVTPSRRGKGKSSTAGSSDVVELSSKSSSRSVRFSDISQESTHLDLNTVQDVTPTKSAPAAKKQRINYEQRVAADQAAARSTPTSTTFQTPSSSFSRHTDSATLRHNIMSMDKQNDLSFVKRSSADLYFDAFSTSLSRKKKRPQTSNCLISSMLPELTPEMVDSMRDFPARTKQTDGACDTLNPESAFNTAALENFAIQLHRQHYSDWSLALSEGFNLLFYGVGSAETILEDFLQERSDLGQGACVIIRGYMPGLRMEQILEAIERATQDSEARLSAGDFGEGFYEERPIADSDSEGDDEEIVEEPDDETRKKYASLQEARAYRIHKKFGRQSRLPPLYLAFLGIDRRALIMPKSQRILKILSSAPRIYLLGTANHVNVGLLLGPSSTSIQWLYQDLHTFVPPVDEMLVASSKQLIRLPRALSLHVNSHASWTAADADDTNQPLSISFPPAQAVSILQAITEKHRQLYCIAAKLQCKLVLSGDVYDDSEDDVNATEGRVAVPGTCKPVRLDVLLESAAKGFVATSMERIKMLLTEFTSHGMLRVARWSEAQPELRTLQQGKEYLWINMSRRHILQVLRSLETLLPQMNDPAPNRIPQHTRPDKDDVKASDTSVHNIPK